MTSAQHLGAAAPFTPPVQNRTGRAPPEPRRVEASADASQGRAAASSLSHRPEPRIRDLSASARQFVAILEATGSVELAMRVSGMNFNGVDTYA